MSRKRGSPPDSTHSADLMRVFGECIGKVPEASRALKAWQRMEILGEGAPISWERVASDPLLSNFWVFGLKFQSSEVAYRSADLSV